VLPLGPTAMDPTEIDPTEIDTVGRAGR